MSLLASNDPLIEPRTLIQQFGGGASEVCHAKTKYCCQDGSGAPHSTAWWGSATVTPLGSRPAK